MTERITFKLRTTRTVRCKCACVCVFITYSTFHTFPISHPLRRLGLSLSYTSCPLTAFYSSLIYLPLGLSPSLFLSFLSASAAPIPTSQPTFLLLFVHLLLLCHYSHFCLPDSCLLCAPPVSCPPAGYQCYRTVRRRPWIRPLKGTSMLVRTTSCRSWPRPSLEKSRGWREMTCVVTAEHPVSGKDWNKLRSKHILWSSNTRWSKGGVFFLHPNCISNLPYVIVDIFQSIPWVFLAAIIIQLSLQINLHRLNEMVNYSS